MTNGSRVYSGAGDIAGSCLIRTSHEPKVSVDEVVGWAQTASRSQSLFGGLRFAHPPYACFNLQFVLSPSSPFALSLSKGNGTQDRPGREIKGNGTQGSPGKGSTGRRIGFSKIKQSSRRRRRRIKRCFEARTISGEISVPCQSLPKRPRSRASCQDPSGPWRQRPNTRDG